MSKKCVVSFNRSSRLSSGQDLHPSVVGGDKQDRVYCARRHRGCVSVPAFTVARMNETPLVSATWDEGEQTQGCDTESLQERRKWGAVDFPLGVNLHPAQQPAKHGGCSSWGLCAAGRRVAFLINPDCSLTSAPGCSWDISCGAASQPNVLLILYYPHSWILIMGPLRREEFICSSTSHQGDVSFTSPQTH